MTTTSTASTIVLALLDPQESSALWYPPEWALSDGRLLYRLRRLPSGSYAAYVYAPGDWPNTHREVVSGLAVLTKV